MLVSHTKKFQCPFPCGKTLITLAAELKNGSEIGSSKMLHTVDGSDPEVNLKFRDPEDLNSHIKVILTREMPNCST